MEIQIDNTKLRVYEDGKIERFHKKWNKWTFVKGNDNGSGYLKIRIDKKNYYIHRIIAHIYLGLNLESPTEVDHIDRNGFNNHVSNLRLVTSQENSLNTESTENSKGYWITKYGNYCVRIWINGKSIGIGTYQTEYDAIRRYAFESEKFRRLRMVN